MSEVLGLGGSVSSLVKTRRSPITVFAQLLNEKFHEKERSLLSLRVVRSSVSVSAWNEGTDRRDCMDGEAHSLRFAGVSHSFSLVLGLG